jgi:hypothetical protein
VIVGFPFSTIRIEDRDSSRAVAELLGRLCQELADGASAEQFAELGAEANDLAEQLRK